MLLHVLHHDGIVCGVLWVPGYWVPGDDGENALARQEVDEPVSECAYWCAPL